MMNLRAISIARARATLMVTGMVMEVAVIVPAANAVKTILPMVTAMVMAAHTTAVRLQMKLGQMCRMTQIFVRMIFAARHSGRAWRAN